MRFCLVTTMLAKIPSPTSRQKLTFSEDKLSPSSVRLCWNSTRQFAINFALGWWNNHDGGFIKMTVIQGVAPVFDRGGQEASVGRMWNEGYSSTDVGIGTGMIERRGPGCWDLFQVVPREVRPLQHIFG